MCVGVFIYIVKRLFLPDSRNKTLQCYDYGKIYLDQLVKADIRTFDNIRKFVPGQGDDYTTGCLLD